METNPLVSAVIPVFNGERYLADTIRSVLSQTYRPVEVIVVDDGSVDGTAKIATSFKEVRYVPQKNQGHGMAKNNGIAATRGELIAFLDADDLWTPDKLSVQAGYMMKNPDIGYTIARMRVFLDPGIEWPAWLNKPHYMSDPPGYVPGTLVACKTVFERIGLFNTGYRHGNDSDWFFRAKDAGIPMAVMPEILLHKRIHSSNMSHEVPLMTAELLRTVRSSILRQQNKPETP